MANGHENAEALRRGIELCRAGDWQGGLRVFGQVLSVEENRSGSVPAIAYSYFGYALARHGGKRREGLALCEHAVRLEFFQPENYLNLARTHLLLGDRKAAIAAIERGLKVVPDHRGLIALRREMGERRRPVLGFLARANPLNRLLGRIRHDVTKPKGG